MKGGHEIMLHEDEQMRRRRAEERNLNDRQSAVTRRHEVQTAELRNYVVEASFAQLNATAPAAPHAL